MTDTSKLRYVYVAEGYVAVQRANGYTNIGYRCRSQHERYITAKTNKKTHTKNTKQKNNNNSHFVVVVLGAAKNVGHLNGIRSSCSHYRQHNVKNEN